MPPVDENPDTINSLAAEIVEVLLDISEVDIQGVKIQNEHQELGTLVDCKLIVQDSNFPSCASGNVGGCAHA